MIPGWMALARHPLLGNFAEPPRRHSLAWPKLAERKLVGGDGFEPPTLSV